MAGKTTGKWRALARSSATPRLIVGVRPVARARRCARHPRGGWEHHRASAAGPFSLGAHRLQTSRCRAGRTFDCSSWPIYILDVRRLVACLSTEHAARISRAASSVDVQSPHSPPCASRSYRSARTLPSPGAGADPGATTVSPAHAPGPRTFFHRRWRRPAGAADCIIYERG